MPNMTLEQSRELHKFTEFLVARIFFKGAEPATAYVTAYAPSAEEAQNLFDAITALKQ